MGVSRGGLNTKLTALLDGRWRELQVRVDSGPRADCQMAEEITPPTGKRVIVDKGYDNARLREHITRGRTRTGIATRCRRVPFQRGRLRHRAENIFQRLERSGAIAPRYDKLSLHFQSAVQLVAVLD